MDYLDNIGLLCGFVFLVASAMMKMFPPRKINSLYGYRTTSSMRSDVHWQFAQHYSTVRMFESALFLLLLGTAFEVSDWTQKTKMTVGLMALLAVSVYLIARTEMALKRKFPR